MNKHRIVNSRLRHRRQIVVDRDNINKQRADYSYAGFWMRFWAFLLDLLTVFALNGLLVHPLLAMTSIDALFPAAFTAETLLTAIVFFLYFAIMTKKYGQTIGKMVFGLEVITAEEGELTWTQIIFREGIGRFLHQAFFLFYTLYVMVAFTGKKQGLHDFIADTYVVLERK